MGTRGVISAEQADGTIKGVYVHWDGYPSHMLHALRAIVERDGRDKAVEVLINGLGWSLIGPNDEAEGLSSDRRFNDVPGYGRHYTSELATGPSWVGLGYRQSQGDEYRYPGDGGEEFWYVIRNDGSVVWTDGDANTGPWFGEEDDDQGSVSFDTWQEVTVPQELVEG